MFKMDKFRIEILKKLMPYAYGVKKFFLLNIILSVLAIAISFLTPQVYKMFIDTVIINGEYNKFALVLVGYLTLFALSVVIGYIGKYATNRLVNRMIFNIKFKIWKGYFKKDFTFYEKMSIGDMKMRMDDDITCIANFSSTQTIEYYKSVITLMVVLVLLFFIEWRLAIYSVIAIPFTFWIDHIISSKEKVLKDENRKDQQDLSSWLHITVQGWREVKALNLERYEMKKYVKFLHRYALYFAKWINYWVARVLVIPRIKEEFLMKFLLYFLGGLLIINGNLTIGTLLVFAQYYQILSDVVQTASSTNAQLQNEMPMNRRVLEELDKGKDLSVPTRIPTNSTDNITFENVSFMYPQTDKVVLNNLNLRITKGERVALIGKSGSGKTTMLNLMMGLLKPTSGSVKLSNEEVTELNPNYLYKKIGVVMQENMLFHMTIRENLLFGKEDATEEELIDACKKACIYDYIKRAPKGFDTIIGEKGIKLSGGQRQRIVLARLFLRNVDVFIFDEATSGLDQYSENIIQDTISEIGRDKTIIVVAHRQSSIAICERIIEVKEGRLYEVS